MGDHLHVGFCSKKKRDAVSGVYIGREFTKRDVAFLPDLKRVGLSLLSHLSRSVNPVWISSTLSIANHPRSIGDNGDG